MDDRERFADRPARLQQIDLAVRRVLELNEARIPEVNAPIERLVSAGLAPSQTAILSGMLHAQPYGVEGPSDSGRILQAAAPLPGGMGIVAWDSEDDADHACDPDASVREAFVRFVPFHELPPAIVGLLLPHLAPMVDRVLQWVRPR